jgi:hypothetical protein
VPLGRSCFEKCGNGRGQDSTFEEWCLGQWEANKPAATLSEYDQLQQWNQGLCQGIRTICGQLRCCRSVWYPSSRSSASQCGAITTFLRILPFVWRTLSFLKLKLALYAKMSERQPHLHCHFPHLTAVHVRQNQLGHEATNIRTMYPTPPYKRFASWQPLTIAVWIMRCHRCARTWSIVSGPIRPFQTFFQHQMVVCPYKRPLHFLDPNDSNTLSMDREESCYSIRSRN